MPNAQKTPLARSLNRFFDHKQDVVDGVANKFYPASVLSVDPTGTIVTIQMEIDDEVLTYPDVTCPMFGPENIRYPLVKGVKGIAISADIYMGGMSGLGDGQATLTPRGNLSTMVFIPCGNTNFDPTDDPDKVVIYGKKGTVFRTTDKKTVINAGPVPNGGDANVLQLSTLVSAANDADAASKKVPVNGLYQTSGAVKVRLS